MTVSLTDDVQDHGLDGGRGAVEVHPAAVGATVAGLHVVEDQSEKIRSSR